MSIYLHLKRLVIDWLEDLIRTFLWMYILDLALRLMERDETCSST